MSPAQPTPVTYVITFDIRPGCADRFLALLTPVLDAMRHEAGFINAVLHRDPEAPDRFMLYETWHDHDEVMAVEIHRDYRREYWAKLPGLLARPRQLQVWRPLRADFAGRAPHATAGSRMRQLGMPQSISARTP